MNIAQNIDKTLLQDSLNSASTKGVTHHGYSFEEFVILALGFTEQDGTPYRSIKQGGTQKHNQDFDIPQEVVARNPIIPNNLQGNWSIKVCEYGKSIGLGMASNQFDAWAKDGIVQAIAFYKKEGGRKVLSHFSIHRIEPSAELWGNLTKEKIAKIDPMVRKDKSIEWSKEQAKRLNRWSNGTIGIRNISRDFINDKGKRQISRNLQCYMTFSNYMKLIA
jgi:hypothetical protein